LFKSFFTVKYAILNFALGEILLAISDSLEAFYVKQVVASDEQLLVTV